MELCAIQAFTDCIYLKSYKLNGLVGGHTKLQDPCQGWAGSSRLVVKWLLKGATACSSLP